ncbi:MAG: pantoate--beta-alanine ligase [Planctomycetes bacterium]|nr:pantoate--beta-alanine ligase [Planctomycetota bacterium]
MKTLRTIEEVRAWRSGENEVGFVPTMGALHEGHASLIRRSASENAATLVSVFVNPTQFGPNEDLAKYPRTLDADLALCEAAGATGVFTPDKEMIYPPGFRSWVIVDELGDRLCGASRPGHFKGVTTVVAKLFNITNPTRAYFGQKDAQQALILRRMVIDLNIPLELVVCPIVREPDGLAMSSRNRYLNPEERKRAACLRKALAEVEKLHKAGTRKTSILRPALVTILDDHVDKLDYAEIVDADTLEPLDEVDRPTLVAVAAFVGSTRLIDNVILGLRA